MNCEIEFLPVGDASKAGDAIVLRYGDDRAFDLMLVDGGYLETGRSIIEHMQSQFPHRGFEHVVLTHADVDHASGLRTVLEEMDVANLWMLLPWNHAAESKHLFADKTISNDALARAIKSEYPVLAELVDIAQKRRIQIWWPFQGSDIGPFRVMSPSRSEYIRLLPQFDRTPDVDAEAIKREGRWIGKDLRYVNIFAKVFEKAKSWIADWWSVEQLRDGAVTSATNESSVVLYGRFDEGRRVLLTGDAGVVALSAAADYAEVVGLPLKQFTFVQIPHHGSRSNVGPAVLDRLIGPIQPAGVPTRFLAFVSAPKDDNQHPRRMVTNAFTRRGGNVFATQGKPIAHSGGFSRRYGYYDTPAIPFSDRVEAYDT